MPEDCNNDDLTCQPAGSNPLPAGSTPDDPCAPCFEPTCDNFLDVLAELARQVCALGNSVKAWNQLLAKFRNRLNRIENTLNNLPGAEDAAAAVNPCANVDEVDLEDGADGVLACDDDVQKIFVPGEDDECRMLGSREGKWRSIPKGLSFHPLETAQALVIGANASLNEYEEHSEIGCELWAVIEFGAFITAAGSGGGTFGMVVNGRTLDQAYIVSGGGATLAGQGFVPLTSESLAISIVNYGSSGSISFSSQSYTLLGYLA